MGSDLLLSIVLFVVIGIIVSMDVAGLTISKTEQFVEKPKSIWLWCVSNALWHTGLLALYLLVINGIIKISPEYLRFVDNALQFLWQQLQFLPNGLLQAIQYNINGIKLHLNVVLGVVALAVVWQIYSKKIIETPSEGEVSDLRGLARFSFNLIDLVARSLGLQRAKPKRLREFLHNQAQAALVAVDMLALAILLKSTNAIQGVSEGCLVVVIVFIVVLFITHMVATSAIKQFSQMKLFGPESQRHRVRAMYWLRITLRLGEPFLIFYFVLQLVSLLLLGEQSQGVSLFFGAGVLVWALIDKYSLATIAESVLSKTKELGRTQALRTSTEIFSDLGFFFFKCGLVILFFPLALTFFSLLTWVTSMGSNYPLSFDEQISRVVGMLTILSAGTFAPRLLRFTWLEDQLIRGIHFIMANRRTFVFMATAMFMATVFPIYDQMLEEARRAGTRPNLLSLRELLQPNHKHVLQVGIWFALFVTIGTCLERAESKYKITLGDLSQKPAVLKLYGWWLYSGILTVIGGLLILVGFLQGAITN